MTMHLRVLLTALLISSSCFADQKHWNQFRGPDGNGQSSTTGLPLNFGEASNVVWKTSIEGKGWSSPVAWGDQIWLTTAPADGQRMFALCVDFKSGKVVKKLTVLENEKPQFCHPLNSYATPTPVVEEGRVYVHFGAHGTACIDTTTGRKIWQRRDLECDHHRGPASSPIVHGDLLFVLFDGFDLQYVVALNKNTGKTVWKKSRAFDFRTNNGDLKKAYCTPTVIEHAGTEQLICPAAIATEAFDPKDGRLLWTVRHGGMNASARPLYGNGLVFISNGMGKMVVLQPQATAGSEELPVVWSSGKSIPKKSSMILIDDLLYMVSDLGVASCVEASTGRPVWKKRINGEYAASPILADGRIYFFSRKGHITVIAPGREFKVLAESKLAGGFMASAAIVGKSMILRTESHLYRFEDRAE